MNITQLLSPATVIVALVPLSVSAHEWHHHSQSCCPDTHLETEASHSPRVYFVVGSKQGDNMTDRPGQARHFEHFKNVKTRWDSDWLYVESNGLPDHNMMVGIRAWQQQVPLPQPFTGNNAWQLPLHQKLADKPVSAKDNLFRGAIALAVNGVPIFNALNNRGEDALLAGELDKWGGHCGRRDDYHYHIAPVHLEKIVGRGNPIAYALDGFPIYGLTEADGSPVGELDEFNGQFDDHGRYHYHATEQYPYINGGMRGIVTIRGDQIEPQPRDSPVRQAFPPLRGATIIDFKTTGEQSVLTYRAQDQTGTITYSPVDKDSWKFTYDDPGGNSRTETYQRRPRRNDGRGHRPPPPRGNRPPPPR